MRTLSERWATIVAWIAYSWMGIVVLLCICLFGIDLIRWAYQLFSKPIIPERRVFLSRLWALSSLGAGALLSGIALSRALQRVSIKDLRINLSRLPNEFIGFRIVHLTDLHIGPTLKHDWVETIVEQVNSIAPDMVVITGDLVDGSVERLAKHVAPLQRIQTRHGVYFVTGNHEYYSGADEWINELTRLGVRVLRNERVPIRIPGGSYIDLIGIDDYHSGGFPGHGPDLPRALEGRDPNQVAILLAHQPAAVSEASEYGVDLQLSGHTHGGQLWPWNYFVRLQQPYVAGLHRHNNTNTQIYVSPGTGYWGPPMRLGTKAEITHITLWSQDKMG